MRYMSGEYVLVSIPTLFRMEQLPTGVISLAIGADGAKVVGRQINGKGKYEATITDAVLVSESLPMDVSMARMIPAFKKMLPFSLANGEDFSFLPVEGDKHNG